MFIPFLVIRRLQSVVAEGWPLGRGGPSGAVASRLSQDGPKGVVAPDWPMAAPGWPK